MRGQGFLRRGRRVFWQTRVRKRFVRRARGDQSHQSCVPSQAGRSRLLLTPVRTLGVQRSAESDFKSLEYQRYKRPLAELCARYEEFPCAGQHATRTIMIKVEAA